VSEPLETALLRATLHNDVPRALELLASHPTLGTASVATAAAVGDIAALTRHLAADPTAASRPVQPGAIQPLVLAVVPALKAALQVSVATQRRVVELLLDHGADPNASVPLGHPASQIPVLYFASDAGCEPIVRLLLERGALPNDGESVYHAAQRDHRDCLATLLEFWADLSGVHPVAGNTPLYFLASHRPRNPVTPAAVRGIEWLLEHGADPNVASFATPEHLSRSNAGESPLHRVAACGHSDVVAQLLVTHGAAIDPARVDGKTPYRLAIRTGNTTVASFLQRAGADTTTLTAVDRLLGACAIADAFAARAIVDAHPTIVSELTDEDCQALSVAIDEERDACVAVMLSVDWPLAVEGEWGGTPLHWAAWRGRAALVQQLLAAGAPLNARDSAYGSSPIAWASHGSTNAGHNVDADYVAIANLLLDAGATRAESFNKWDESPEGMASAVVRSALIARGFGTA
jgi:ankyrin repeat protein